jgi:hypothetical protein
MKSADGKKLKTQYKRYMERALQIREQSNGEDPEIDILSTGGPGSPVGSPRVADGMKGGPRLQKNPRRGLCGL